MLTTYVSINPLRLFYYAGELEIGYTGSDINFLEGLGQ